MVKETTEVIYFKSYAEYQGYMAGQAGAAAGIGAAVLWAKSVVYWTIRITQSRVMMAITAVLAILVLVLDVAFLLSLIAQAFNPVQKDAGYMLLVIVWLIGHGFGIAMALVMQGCSVFMCKCTNSWYNQHDPRSKKRYRLIIPSAAVVSCMCCCSWPVLWATAGYFSTAWGVTWFVLFAILTALILAFCVVSWTVTVQDKEATEA